MNVREARSSSNDCIFWVCVCSLSYLACAVLSVICGLSGCTIFPTLSHNRHDCRGKKALNIKCVCGFPLQRLSETFLILRRTEQISEMCIGLRVKYHYSCPILMKHEFSPHFLKIFRHQILWKFVHWEPSCCLRTDGRTNGQTEMTNQQVAFRSGENSNRSFSNLDLC